MKILPPCIICRQCWSYLLRWLTCRADIHHSPTTTSASFGLLLNTVSMYQLCFSTCNCRLNVTCLSFIKTSYIGKLTHFFNRSIHIFDVDISDCCIIYLCCWSFQYHGSIHVEQSCSTHVKNTLTIQASYVAVHVINLNPSWGPLIRYSLFIHQSV